MKFSKYQKNGNVAQQKWKITNRSVKQYDYTYDGNDRLTSANYGYYVVPPPPAGMEIAPQYVSSDEYTVPSIGYDAAGKILSIERMGMTPLANGCFEPNQIDVLDFVYNDKFQLYSVDDDAPASYRTYGFKPGSNANSPLPYSHDANGNMTNDPNKNINLKYNFLNLPKEIGQMEITYDATGRKWEKVGQFGTTEYLNGVEHHPGDGSTGGQIIIPMPDGRLVLDEYTGSTPSFRAEYFHQDHLGNTRLAFCDFSQNGLIEIADDPTTPANEQEITQEQHYYPFGMEQLGNWYATVAPDNLKLYNGKELNRDFDINLYEYGARWYDPALGRFIGVDKLADHPNQVDKSPYAYAWNNPVKYTDPDGNCPICPYIVGAISGAALDYAVQVGTNLYEGKGASSFTDIDGGSLLVSAGAGATGVGLAKNGGKLLQMMKGSSKVDDVANVADDVITKVDDVKNPFLKKSKSDLLNDKDTFSKMIKDHQSKLDDFIKDPIGNSSEKWLKTATKDNPTKEVLLERAKGRIPALQKQIQKQQGELNKINDALKKIDG